MSAGADATENARKRSKSKSPKEPKNLENQENSTAQTNATENARKRSKSKSPKEHKNLENQENSRAQTNATENAQKRSKSKSSKEPKNVENQGNSTQETNEQDPEDRSIKCPHCHRRFERTCHLKFHSVIHRPGWEGNRPIRRYAKKEKTLDPRTGKRLYRKRHPRWGLVQEAASSSRAPFSDVSNGETSSPVPGSVATEGPPPRVSSAVHSAAPVDHDVHWPEISASASTSQVEYAANISWPEWPPSNWNESSRDARIEPSPGHAAVPAAIESQPQLRELLETAEIVPDEIIYDALASLDLGYCSYCSVCEIQMGVQCPMQPVGELPPISFPYVDNADLFVEGTSLLLDEIELAERFTTSEEDYLKMLALITRCPAGMEDREDQPSSYSDGSLLKYCEGVVPDDFYEVLMSVALQ